MFTSISHLYMPYFVYEIEGIDVNFPFKAYPQQLEYMQEFIKSMKQGINCALEAPTGFGKSLCVIAPYVAFWHWYDEAVKTFEGLQIAIAQLGRRVGKKELIDRCAILMNKEVSTAEKLINFLITTNPFSKQITISNNLYSLKPLDVKKCQVARLIYTSRTHQQLKQVYSVVSTYFPDCVNSLMYFASREHLCVNSLTLNAAQEQKISLNTMCKHHCSTKQCQYNETKEIPIKGVDFEDFKLKCQRERVCPYNVTRDFLVYQNIVLCPYNYILDSINRNNDFHQVLINSIVVFDEAHSCYNNAKAVYEHTFTKKDIQEAVENLILAMRIIDGRWLHLGDMRGGGRQKVAESHQHLFQKYQVIDIAQSIGKLLLQRFSDYERLAQSELYANQNPGNQNFTQQKTWYKRESLEKLFQSAPVKIFNQECLELLYDIDYYIYNTRINFKTLRNSLINIDEQKLFQAKLGKAAAFRKLLEIYANCLGHHNELKKGLEVVIEAEQSKDGKQTSKCTFKYTVQCYTPALSFDQLLSAGIRCFLFTSGTLRPLESLDDQYGIVLRTKKSFEPVFDMNSRLDARIIEGTDAKNIVSGEFNRRTPFYYDQITQIITKYISDVPDVGILVFLTSYEQLKQIESRLSPIQHQHNFQLLVEKSNGKQYGEKNVKQEGNTGQHEQIQDWELDFSDDNVQPFEQIRRQPVSDDQIQYSNVDTDLLKDLTYLVKEKRRKTLVLAVLRGKLSEGIDFAGDLCRCVIIVGVPYLNRNDPTVARQLAWLDEQHASKTIGYSNGNSMLRSKPQSIFNYRQASNDSSILKNDQIFSSTVYYTQQAFQAVCQALGRLIRSERDYGRVLLVDQRYTYLRNYLPKFLQNVPSQTLDNFESSLNGFFVKKEREFQLQNQSLNNQNRESLKKDEQLNKSISEFMSGSLSLSMSFEQSQDDGTNMKKGKTENSINKKKITLEQLSKTMGQGLNDRERFNGHYLRSQVEYITQLNQCYNHNENQLFNTIDNTTNIVFSGGDEQRFASDNHWWDIELKGYLENRGLLSEYNKITKQPASIQAYNTVALVKRLPYAYGISIIASASEDVQQELYMCF